MINTNEFPEYTGNEGPDPIEFSVAQLRALADLLSSMGIHSIRMDPRKQDSPIHVQYVDHNSDIKGSRLYWRKDR